MSRKSLIGQTVGPYKVQSLLGTGGMGSVYKAEHTVIGREVALKTIHPEMAQRRDYLERFFNEARAVNKIRHDHIVDIYDVGETSSGVVYCVMELLEGQSLATLKKRKGKLTPELAVDITRQVASALGASHSKGIVHRDLKPENIFIIQRPQNPHFVKVLDFGIAKLLTQGSKSATRTGVVFGTPYYMAPEQCRGAANVDHRADIYGLGAILYELVTGERVFEGEGPGDVMIKHATEPPVPPIEHRPELPRWLNAAILRAMEKDREKRYQSMEAFSSGLEPQTDRYGIRSPEEDGYGDSQTTTVRPIVPGRSAARPSADDRPGTVSVDVPDDDAETPVPFRPSERRTTPTVMAVKMEAPAADLTPPATGEEPEDVPEEGRPVTEASLPPVVLSPLSTSTLSGVASELSLPPGVAPGSRRRASVIALSAVATVIVGIVAVGVVRWGADGPRSIPAAVPLGPMAPAGSPAPPPAAPATLASPAAASEPAAAPRVPAATSPAVPAAVKPEPPAAQASPVPPSAAPAAVAPPAPVPEPTPPPPTPTRPAARAAAPAARPAKKEVRKEKVEPRRETKAEARPARARKARKARGDDDELLAPGEVKPARRARPKAGDDDLLTPGAVRSR